MWQLIDGTFEEAKHYRIPDHRFVEKGPWNDWHACWFNAPDMRTIPSDAIAVTSAYLDRAVTAAVPAHHLWPFTLEQKRKLAAVIHLCGAGAGDLYVRRGLRLLKNEKCGDHEASMYVGRVKAVKRVFARLAGQPAECLAVELFYHRMWKKSCYSGCAREPFALSPWPHAAPAHHTGQSAISKVSRTAAAPPLCAGVPSFFFSARSL